MAQFASSINNAISQKRMAPQGNRPSHARNFNNIIILAGTQHTVNPNTIAMANVNTFLFLFARLSSALDDWFPEKSVSCAGKR